MAASDASASDRLDRSTLLALVAMGLAVLIIANDFTALSVALPAIERDLDTDLTTVQWVINAYALVFGVLIVTGGKLADMFGRRRVFVIGAAIFAGFSLLGGVAPDDLWLIACRALMGVGGALMWPAVLGMTFDALPASKAGLAGGLIMGAAGFGNAIGPMIGGVLTDELSWRWIFYLNIPIAAFGVFVTLKAIKPDPVHDQRERLDYVGVATLSLSLVSFLLALDQSTDWGWGDPRVIAFVVLGVVLMVAFVLAERRADLTALVPHDVMGNRNFTAACIAVLLISACFFAALLYLPQFMTKVLGYSALKGGIGLLPMMGTFALVSFIAGPFYTRVGPKVVVSLGAACISLGMLLLSFIEEGDSYSSLLVGMFVLGAGIGFFYSSVTTAGITALDESRASLAGGIVYMFQIAGGSIGLGINTAIVASAGSSLALFTDGISDAFLLDAVLALLGLVVALLLVGGRMHANAVHRHRRHAARAHP